MFCHRNFQSSVVLLVAAVCLGGCGHTVRSEGGAETSSSLKPQVEKLQKVDNSSVTDADLVAQSTIVCDAVLLNNMSRLTMIEARTGADAGLDAILLLTFRVIGQPIKGEWTHAGILVEDDDHCIDAGLYAYYKPLAVYRLYVEGVDPNKAKRISIRLMKDHI